VACAVFFFARDPVSVEEPPQRANPDRRGAFGQQRLQLDHRDVVLRLDCAENEGRMRVDPGRTTVAALRLSCQRAVLKDQLPPADRAFRAYPEPCCRGPARHPAINRGDQPLLRSCDSTRGIHADLLDPARA